MKGGSLEFWACLTFALGLFLAAATAGTLMACAYGLLWAALIWQALALAIIYIYIRKGDRK